MAAGPHYKARFSGQLRVQANRATWQPSTTSTTDVMKMKNMGVVACQRSNLMHIFEPG